MTLDAYEQVPLKFRVENYTNKLHSLCVTNLPVFFCDLLEFVQSNLTSLPSVFPFEFTCVLCLVRLDSGSTSHVSVQALPYVRRTIWFPAQALLKSPIFLLPQFAPSLVSAQSPMFLLKFCPTSFNNLPHVSAQVLLHKKDLVGNPPCIISQES